MANPLIRSNLESIGQRPGLAALCIPVAQTCSGTSLRGGAQAPESELLGRAEALTLWLWDHVKAPWMVCVSSPRL